MKRVWTKSHELEKIKELFRQELRECKGAILIPYDRVIPLLEKPEPSRIVWNRVCRREFERWGLRVGIRTNEKAYRVQIVDPLRWQKVNAGHSSSDSAQDTMPPNPDEPNGLIPSRDYDYILPEWADHLRQSLEDGERVLLTGPTGSGKSSLVRELCARHQKPFMRINLNGETSVADIVGGWRVRGKDMTFQYGPIPEAMKIGAWLCLDELDAALPQVLFVLQALLEDGGKLFISDTNEWITPHPEFRLVATANTIGKGDDSGMYAGTNVLNEAFLDRFHAVFEVDYLPSERGSVPAHE